MNSVLTYLRESYDELRNHVTWPSLKDLQKSAIIVAISSIVIALVIGLMDMSGNVLFNDFIYKLIN